MSGYAAWNPYDAYAVGDVVSYAGLNYVAASANINTVPFPATPVWTYIPSGGGGGGGLTNPLTTDLDLGANDIINTNDTQTTSIGVDVIDLRAGSLAPRITVSQGMDFTSITSTTFTTVPQTNAVPTVGDDLTNKTYVDGLLPTGPSAYGNFYSLASQLFTATPGVPLTLGSVSDSNLINNIGSNVLIQKAGVYSMTFSAQIVGGANEQVLVYFALNGSPIADSGSYIDVKNGETQMLTVNLIQTLAITDIIEVLGISPSGLSGIVNIATPPTSSPSLIFTIQEIVGQGPQGPTGPAGPPGGITNPLTADILANGFSIQNAATISANTLTVSSDPSINVSSPIIFTDPTIPAQFTLPPQTSVAPTVGNDLTNKTYVDGLTPNLAGLFNYLRIVPTAAGQTISTVYYTGGSGVGYPSPWIPDATPNTTILPTAGTSNEWALNKVASPAGATQRWWAWPYNYYPAPSYGPNAPPSAPSVPIIKKNLNALYAIIRVKSSVNITIQGAIFFNIYSYDYSTAPAQPYSVRHDYQANNLALPNTTGALNLQSGFTYLVYACDAEKTVASSAAPTPGAPAGSAIVMCNGQTPSQLTSEMLRDPYDIHTDLNHIPLPAVAYALGATPPAASAINDLPISGIAFACPSNAITNGANIELIAIGYRANGGAINEEYSLQFT